jgi:hypothetical protein
VKFYIPRKFEEIMDRLLAVALSLGLTRTLAGGSAKPEDQPGRSTDSGTQSAQRELLEGTKLDVEFFYADGGAGTLDAVISGSVRRHVERSPP